MSEEEKAIKILKETDLYNLGHDDRFEELRLYENALETVLNLISNLQKENEELHKEINQRIKLKLENEKTADDLYNKIKILQKELDKKDKEIKKLKEDISNMYDEKVVRNILEDECGLSKFEIDEILN